MLKFPLEIDVTSLYKVYSNKRLYGKIIIYRTMKKNDSGDKDK